MKQNMAETFNTPAMTEFLRGCFFASMSAGKSQGIDLALKHSETGKSSAEIRTLLGYDPEAMAKVIQQLKQTTQSLNVDNVGRTFPSLEGLRDKVPRFLMEGELSSDDAGVTAFQEFIPRSLKKLVVDASTPLEPLRESIIRADIPPASGAGTSSQENENTPPPSEETHNEVLPQL